MRYRGSITSEMEVWTRWAIKAKIQPSFFYSPKARYSRLEETDLASRFCSIGQLKLTTRNSPLGTYQIGAHRRERHDPHHGREAGDGHVAGDLVFGVSGCEAYEECRCYDSGGEDVMAGGWDRWGAGERGI